MKPIDWDAVAADDATVTAYIERQMIDALAEERMSLPEWRAVAIVRPPTFTERLVMALQRIARRLTP